MIWRLAWRNLARNRWRSALTAGGVAVAVGLMVWTMAYMDGFFSQMVRGATALETGQAIIERDDYVDDPSIYEAFDLDGSLLDKVDKVDGVSASAPRVNLYGLIGNEKRSQVAKVMGVDARREARATPITDGIINGHWLSDKPKPPPAPQEAVLGEGLARQLNAKVGTELVVFLQASDGSLGNDLLKVVGIVKTGNSAVDRQAAYVHLDEAQFLGALDGKVHEIIVRTDDPATADAVVDRLAPLVQQAHAAAKPASKGDTANKDDDFQLIVRSWKKARPQIAQMLQLSDSSNLVMFLILYLLASLGLLNTQRMSALERKREFAVMMAIGVTPRRLFSVIVAETVLLSLAGALAGVALGGAVSWYHTVYGLDMSTFSSNANFTWMGVSFSQRLYFSLSVKSLVEPLVIMLGVAVLCGLWPAAKAIGIDIAPSIAGRN